MIDGRQFDRDTWGTPDYYQAGQNTVWYPVLTNNNVLSLWPTLGRFNTYVQQPQPLVGDYYRFYDAQGPVVTYYGALNVYGTPGTPAPSGLIPLQGGSFALFYYMFVSDDDHNTWFPPVISGSYVACKSNQTTVPSNQFDLGMAGNTVEMLLLGPGDTIYVYVDQPPQSYGTAVLTHRWQNHADADIYVSATNQLPDDTPGGSEYRSSWGGDDVIQLPYSPTTKRWYVGVHAYTGNPHVVVDVKFRRATNNVPITGFTEFMPTPSEGYTLATYLKKTSIRMFSSTDGGLLLGPYDIYLTTDPDRCDPCHHSAEGVACDLCLDVNEDDHVDSGITHTCRGAPVHMGKQIWKYGWYPTLGAHEFGHACFGLDDEYWPSQPSDLALCGHSIMNSTNITNGFCSRRHCLDALHSGEHLEKCNPSTISNWAWLKTQTELPLTWATDYSAAGVDPRRTDYTNNLGFQDLVVVNYH